VWNLLSNSVKFSEEGGTVSVTVCVGSDVVRLTVEDHGKGIEPAFIPYLFDRFRQADSTPTREHGGLGLGLAIARHLVEAHRGRIDAANRAGGGAIFTVVLPTAPANVGV
jgi:signal transduction histidine kinase